MRLSQQAINKINNSPTRMRLGVALGFSEPHLYKAIKENKINGWMTKASVLKAIEAETGLTQSDILEDVQINEPVTSTR